jgi:hypothetical protein
MEMDHCGQHYDLHDKLHIIVYTAGLALVPTIICSTVLSLLQMSNLFITTTTLGTDLMDLCFSH